jgi:hypothetical protein
VALEPGPLRARVAAQAGRGQEHEPEQKRGGATSDELHAAGGDGVRLAQVEQRVGRPGEPERRPQQTHPARRRRLAFEQSRDLPVVQAAGVDRRRPAVCAVDGREHRQRRELGQAAGEQHGRGAALGLVVAAGERRQGDGQCPGRAADHHQPQPSLGHRRDRRATRLQHLAAGGHAGARQPSRAQPHPAAGGVDRPELDEVPAEVQLGEGQRPRGRRRAQARERLGRCSVDPGVAAGGRRSQPGGGEAALGDGQVRKPRAQAAVGRDRRAADDAAEGRRRHRDADRDEAAAPGTGARSRRRHPKRRPGRPRSGSHIGANLQPRRMFAPRPGRHKRESASAVFTPRELPAAAARFPAGRRARRRRRRMRR